MARKQKTLRKPTDTVQLKLRFSEAQRRRLEREALRHGRSLNAEIVWMIGQALQRADDAEEIARSVTEAVGVKLFETLVEAIQKARAADAESRKRDFGLFERAEDAAARDRRVAAWIEDAKTKISKAEATAREAEAKVQALTDIPTHRAITLITDVQKKEGSWPESFGPIIEMLIKDSEARGRKAEGAQEAEKAKTAPSVLTIHRPKQASGEGQ